MANIDRRMLRNQLQIEHVSALVEGHQSDIDILHLGENPILDLRLVLRAQPKYGNIFL